MRYLAYRGGGGGVCERMGMRMYWMERMWMRGCEGEEMKVFS